MAIRGKSFSINTGNLDRIVGRFKAENDRADRLMFRKVKQATNIIYRVAHAKRPMISKQQAKAQGRRVRVSDPQAEAGVPVRSGALQASLQQQVRQKVSSVVGRIWTNSPYASFMEFGTSKAAARPFMRPAVNLTREAIKAMFAKQEDA